VILARLKTGAPGGWPFPRAHSAGVTAVSWGRAVPGVTHGRQPAVRRQVLRRGCQPGRGGCPAGARARPAERARHRFACQPRCLAWDRAPNGARRAPRALEDV
jgi:hypothetical protein